MHPKAVATAGSTFRQSAPRVVIGAASFEEIETIADLKQPHRAKAYGRQQHDALEQGLPQRIEIEDEQEVADGSEHQGAEDRANRAARSPEQRDAAEHGG